MNLIVKYIYDAWGNHKTYVLNDNNNDNYDDIETTASNPSTDFNNNKFIAEHNPFRYRSYYYDKESKLYYLNSRYYDPETGRFINSDVISILEQSKYKINGLNLYSYCNNNPIMHIDPKGNSFFSAIGNFIGSMFKSVTNFVVSTITAIPIVGKTIINDYNNTSNLFLIDIETGIQTIQNIGETNKSFTINYETSNNIIDSSIGVSLNIGNYSMDLSLGLGSIDFSIGINDTSIDFFAHKFDVGIGISTEEKLVLNKTVKQYTNISVNILKLAFLYSVIKNIIYSPSPGFINRGV